MNDIKELKTHEKILRDALNEISRKGHNYININLFTNKSSKPGTIRNMTLLANKALADSKLDTHSQHHAPSVERIKEMHSHMVAADWPDNNLAGHRSYGQSAEDTCYLCALDAEIEVGRAREKRLRLALSFLLMDVNSHFDIVERKECLWESAKTARVLVYNE